MTDETGTSVVMKVNETATSLKNQVEELERFRDELDDKINQVERMPERERAAFYENAEAVREDLDGIESVEEILGLEETIEDHIHSPLCEAALAELDSFIDKVGVSLSADTTEDVREKVGNSIPQDLEEIIGTYQDLTEKIDSWPSFLTEIIQDEIESRPTRLTEPGERLQDTVLKLERRQEALKKLDELIQDAGSWTADVVLSEEQSLYQNPDYTFLTGQAKSLFDDIESHIDDIESNGLKISKLVKAELERSLEDGKPESIIPAFKSAAGELNGLKIAFDIVSEWSNDLDDFGADQGMFESKIDELLAEYQKLHGLEFDSIEALRQRCQRLKIDFSSFIETCAEQLDVKLNMAKDVVDELEDVSSPNIEFEPDNTGIVTPESVRSDLNGALNAILDLDEWFKQAFSELGDSFESDDAFEIWKQLYEGESVELTDDNEETILALADRFSIRVELGRE